jgi:SAM-dependent methyltransferase
MTESDGDRAALAARGAQRVRRDIVEHLRDRYGVARVEAQLASLARHGDVIDDAELWLTAALAGDFKFMPIECVDRCPCGSSESRLLSRFVFWNLLGVRECRRCGLPFVAPRLSAAGIERVFNEFYFDHTDPEFWGHRRRPIFRDIVRLLRRLGCISIVDVGAGYGHFLHYAAGHGILGVGCDLSRGAVAWGRARLGVDLQVGRIDQLDLPEGRADAVVCLDTLYYSPQPVSDLLRMRTLLRPGGYVVLRLRNGRKVAARAHQESCRPVGRAVLPSGHLYGFSPATIAPTLEAGGFRLLRCEPAPYSRAPLSLLLQSGFIMNRLAQSTHRSFGILTQSFHVIARRKN